MLIQVPNLINQPDILFPESIGVERPGMISPVLYIIESQVSFIFRILKQKAKAGFNFRTCTGKKCN